MGLFGFFVYTFIYFVGLGSLIQALFDVSPFLCFSFKTKEIFLNPFEDWGILFNRFQYGQWAVDSGRNFAIFISFVLFFPLWIGLWFVVRRIRIIRFFLSPFYHLKRKKLEDVGKKGGSVNQVTPLNNRPRAMPKSASYGSVLPSQAKKMANAEAVPVSGTKTSELSPPSIPDQETDDDDLPFEIKDKVRSIGKTYGLDLFEKVLLDGYVVPLVLATDTRAYLITILSKETDWIADETIADGATEPTWFSTEGLIPSPVYKLTQAMKALQEKEPESELIGLVMLSKGSIINATLMENVWAQSRNFAVKLDDTVDCEGMVTLDEFLKNDNIDTSQIPFDDSMDVTVDEVSTDFSSAIEEADASEGLSEEKGADTDNVPAESSGNNSISAIEELDALDESSENKKDISETGV